MMLYEQVVSLCFSLLFGVFLAFTLSLLKKVIYNKYLSIKLLGSFVLVFISVLIYFYFLELICEANYHIYMLFSGIVGFLFFNKIKDIIVKK